MSAEWSGSNFRSSLNPISTGSAVRSVTFWSCFHHILTRSLLPSCSPNLQLAPLRFPLHSCYARKFQQQTKAASYKNSHIFTQLSPIQLSTVPILSVQILTGNCYIHIYVYFIYPLEYAYVHV